MFKLKKLLISFLISINILFLFSCGVKTIFKDYNDGEMILETTQYSPNQELYANAVMDSGFSMPLAKASGNIESSSESSNRKIILEYNIYAESVSLDKTLPALTKSIEENNGIVDNQSFYNMNKPQGRSLNMVVRIPAEKVENFLNYVNTKLNVTNFETSQKDVTDSYEDIELRLKTYQDEEQKLNELIKKATKVDDLVNIEDKLSNVRYQIDSLNKRLKDYDKKIDYSTFTIYINEVRVYTEVKDNIPTFDKIVGMLEENFDDTINFVINSAIYVFVHIPAIILTIILILIFVLIVSLTKNIIFRKKMNKDNKAIKTKLSKKENIVKKEENVIKTEDKEPNKDIPNVNIDVNN